MECRLCELCNDNTLNCLLLEHAGRSVDCDGVIGIIQGAFDLYLGSGSPQITEGELKAKMIYYIEALVDDEEASEAICLNWVLDYLPNEDLGTSAPIPVFPDKPITT